MNVGQKKILEAYSNKMYELILVEFHFELQTVSKFQSSFFLH